MRHIITSSLPRSQSRPYTVLVITTPFQSILFSGTSSGQLTVPWDITIFVRSK